MIPQPIIPFLVRGTSQSATTLPALDPQIDAFLDGEAAQGEGIEGQLLLAGATAVLQHKMGHRPAKPLPSLAELEENEVRLAPPRAQVYLSRLLKGESPEVMDEWLDLAQSHQVDPAPELLPALLSFGKKQSEHRMSILQIMGARGHWLVEHKQGRSWDWVSTPIEKLWGQAKTPKQKETLFRFARQRDPHKGRNLLELVWEKESETARATYMSQFKTDLVPEDVPFLIKRFESGSHESRRQAADMLAYFPESPPMRQIIPQVEPHLNISRRFMGHRLTFDLDGLQQLLEKEPKFQSHQSKKQAASTATAQSKSRALIDLISFVPLEHWLSRFDIELPTLWRLISNTDRSVRPLLELGFSESVLRSRNPRYVIELIESADPNTIQVYRKPLFTQLSPSEIESIIFKRLTQRPKLFKEHPAYGMILQYSAIFSAEFSRQVTSAWVKGLNSKVAQPDVRFMTHLARFIDPAGRDDFIDALAAYPADSNAYYWKKSIEKADLTLLFRDNMRRAFKD